MTDISKKLEQIEKLKKQIELEKEKVNSYLGKKLISTLDLDYENLNKEFMDQLIDDMVMVYKETHQSTPHETDSPQEDMSSPQDTLKNPTYSPTI